MKPNHAQKWERSLAAEIAAHRLEREYCTNALVKACLMHVKNGDVDLLTGLTECIKMLVRVNEGLSEGAVLDVMCQRKREAFDAAIDGVRSPVGG